MPMPSDGALPATAIRNISPNPIPISRTPARRCFPEAPEYGYLRTIGVRRDSLPVRLPGSFRAFAPAPFDIPTAYLFDLSDTTRLARTTADSYVLSPLLRPARRRANDWNCYGVWRPLHRESQPPGTGDGRRATE